MQLNFYGLIVATATLVGFLIIEKKLRQYKLQSFDFYSLSIVTYVFALVFARVWHVFTDFYLYTENFIEVFYIWQGGMSILGAVLGAILGILFYNTFFQKIPVKALLDIAIFALPISQAIGRLGNYVNQELYGLPTELPWAVTIRGERYHPLFAYEMFFTLSFAIFIYLFESKIRNSDCWRVSTGNLFLLYILYYSIVRFFLDFLRIEKSIVVAGFGVNQIVLLILSFVFAIILLSRYVRFCQKVVAN